MPLSAPSWYTGRFWLMRLGYYKLMAEKEKADDWTWIIDHSIQIGQDKCFVILGIRVCHLPQDRALKYEDVEPIAMHPVKKSNGEIVYEQLESAVKKTGVPRAIVGDYGSDLKSGVEAFCQKHPETSYIYDVTHKMAILLKKVLTKQPQWEEFTKLAKKSKQQLQQTAFAGLVPPKQRTKARYMNTEYLLGWGENMIRLLSQSNEVIQNKGFEPRKTREKFSWLIAFSDDLECWQQLLQVATTTEKFISCNGIQNGIESTFLQELDALGLRQNAVVNKFKNDVIEYIHNENSKARPGERLLGSSAILESIFGAQKNIEKGQAKSGFTGLLLALPALLSKTTADIVHKAMELTPVKNVREWSKENIGVSVQASRKKAFDFSLKTEQNLHQLCSS